MKEKLLSILNKFRNKRILVIGDIMLDKYVWGDVDRISPEAPVPVVKVHKESYAPGGAANVANNIAALEGNALMAGIVGRDSANTLLTNELKKRRINTNLIIIDRRKPTIQKVRIIGQHQQLVRVDYEKKEPVNELIELKLLRGIIKSIQNVDGVVISDYAKGVITERLIKNIIQQCKKQNKVIVIDPKPKHLKYYKNATIITPNYKEAIEMGRFSIEEDEDITKIGEILLKESNSTILITKGEKGMTLFEKDGRITQIPTKAKEVYDVTGAGDTVVATIALALASGADMKEAAILANYAAGIVVGKIGTSTVSIEEIKKSIEDE